jgi:hypothetical protein
MSTEDRLVPEDGILHHGALAEEWKVDDGEQRSQLPRMREIETSQ